MIYPANLAELRVRVSMQHIREFYCRLFVKHSFVPRGDSILFYGFLWFSSTLSRTAKEILLIILLISSLHIIQMSHSTKVLAVFSY